MPIAWRRASVTPIIFLLAACAQSNGAHVASSPRAVRTPSPTPVALSIYHRCGTPAARARPIHFKAADGTRLDGALVGHSRVGIVLAHQYPSSLCDWWSFSVRLARRGIESLIFDFRCSGDSTCPDKTRGHVVSDVAGAAKRLGADGVRKLFLGGASLGGTTVMIAGSQVRPRVAGVVSVSGEINLGTLVGGPPLNALKKIPSLHVPLFIAASRGDPSTLPNDMKALIRRAGTHDKHLLLEPASYGHGVAMLTHPGLEWSRVTAAIISFIRSHS